MAGELFVYYGTEALLIEEAVARLKKKLVDPAMEAFGYQLIDEKQSDPDNIINAVQAIPSFTPSRFILLRDPKFLSGGKAADTEDNGDKPVENRTEEQLTDCFTNIPDNVTVVIQVEGSIDQRKKLGKFLKKQAIGFQEFKAFDSWKRQDVIQWILQYIRKNGLIMSETTADFVAEVAGHELIAVRNELDKVITFCGAGAKEIQLEQVKAVISQGALSFFDLGEYFKKRNIPQCLGILSRLSRDGESPQMVLGYLASQARLLLQLKDLQRLGKKPGEIAGIVKKHPFYIQKILDNELRNFTFAELQSFYYELHDADYKSKTGLLPPYLALEMCLGGIAKA